MYGLFKDYDGGVLTEKPLFYQNTDEFTASILQGISDEFQATAKAVSAKTGIDLSHVPSIGDMMREVIIIDDMIFVLYFFSNSIHFD